MAPTIFRRVSWRWTVVSAICLLAVAPLGAQDEDPPEFSVQAPLAAKSLLLDVTAVDGVLIAVGSRGHILISEDQGQNWRQVEVPTRSGLNAVFFHDRNLGWAVGHDGVIVRTEDGGVTWDRVYWAPEDENPLMDVWFKNPDEGFAVGAYGAFFETVDGGLTWSSRFISDYDFHLNQIAPAESGVLYLAAEAGFFYRSSDGGSNWEEMPSPYEGSYFGVLPLEGESVLAFGLRGHLFRSDNGGETWVEIDTHTVAMLTNSLKLADGTIIVTGLGGVVLVSRDGGHTFLPHQHSDRRGISAVAEGVEDSLVFVGEFGIRTLPLSELNDRKDG